MVEGKEIEYKRKEWLKIGEEMVTCFCYCQCYYTLCA